jgi:hypothetical protein
MIYRPWKNRTRIIESVMRPPIRVACAQAMLMSINSQRIMPGRSSLNDLISSDPTVGFNSRPM